MVSKEMMQNVEPEHDGRFYVWYTIQAALKKENPEFYICHSSYTKRIIIVQISIHAFTGTWHSANSPVFSNILQRIASYLLN